MVVSSVVRLGPSDDHVCTKLLRNALVSYFEKQSTNPSAIDEKSDSSTITISNKYFTANVMLEEIGGSGASTNNTKEDGVILVFDALQSNPDRSASSDGGASFDSLSLAHEKAEESETCGDLLRLCVGVSLTSLSPEEIRGKDCEKEYSRRILWCLDRGYEYVEADLSQEGQKAGHDDRDKEGFARVVEAIQGTVWSSADMSKTKSKQLKDSYQEDMSALESKEEQQREGENIYEPPDPSKFAPIQSKNDDNLTKKMLGTDPKAEPGLLMDPEKVGPEEMAQLRKALEAENVFDQMEGMLKEASRIREASKNGMLSNEERRERAGDAANALMDLMNHVGFEDDDSVGEDSEDS